MNGNTKDLKSSVKVEPQDLKKQKNVESAKKESTKFTHKQDDFQCYTEDTWEWMNE